eukprot:3136615-Rhodomonas_salina.3
MGAWGGRLSSRSAESNQFCLLAVQTVRGCGGTSLISQRFHVPGSGRRSARTRRGRRRATDVTVA